jgi:hypothetical protein
MEKNMAEERLLICSVIFDMFGWLLVCAVIFNTFGWLLTCSDMMSAGGALRHVGSRARPCDLQRGVHRGRSGGPSRAEQAVCGRPRHARERGVPADRGGGAQLPRRSERKDPLVLEQKDMFGR